MTSRWLALLVSNLFFFIAFYFKEKSYLIIINRTLFILISLFFLSAISILYSNNSSEAILFTSKLFIIFFTLYNLAVCNRNCDDFLNYIIKFLIFSLLIEVLYVIGLSIIDGPSILTGISMNQNISSFSILIKLPILIYYQLKNKKAFLPFFILELLVFLSLILLQSRASLFLLSGIYLSIFLYNLRENKTSILNTLKLTLTILIIVFSSQTSSLFKQNSINDLQVLNDESILLRSEYYNIALNSIKENLLIGKGSGSWKVESLKEFSNSVNDSIIPYYVHNDFVQFFYELGILGFIAYLLFFISIITKTISNRLITFERLYLLSFFVFFIDSMLNFPIHRPQVIITFLIISSPIIFKKENYTILPKMPFILGIILISSLSMFIQFKEHKSLTIQDTFINDSMLDKYSLELNEIKNIDVSIPNLSVNTIPITSYLSRYYIEYNDYESALKFSEQGFMLNPHLKYTKEQYLKGLLLNNEFSKAVEISRLLFYQDSYNEVYAETYLDLLFINSKLIEVEELFFNLLKSSQENLIVKLLDYYSNLTVKNLDFLSEALFQSASQFPNNTTIQDLSKKYLK